MNQNTLLFGALAAGALYLGKKQRGLIKYAAWGVAAYAGYTAAQSAGVLAGFPSLGRLSGATVAIEPGMMAGYPMY